MGGEVIQFAAGDRVRHAARPEWGVGVVVNAQAVSDNGQRAQRLVIDFANHERVTLSTAAAQITRETNGDAAAGAGWLGQLDRGDPGAPGLSNLPEEMTDPLSTLGRRLRLTMDLYRFTATPRGLVDWAVAATGLTDPLTRYARNDLEQHFRGFVRKREEHLRQLLWEANRNEQNDLIEQVRQHPLAEAREAAERLLRTM